MDELNELLEMYERASLAINLVSLAISIFTIVVMWKVFTKAGEGGWKILIPVYSDYIHYKIAGCKGRFWVCFFMNLAAMVLLGMALRDFLYGLGITGTRVRVDETKMIICALAGAALVLISAIIRFTVNFSMAKAFCLPAVYGLGLWLLPVIFYAIIAFSSSIHHVSSIPAPVYETEPAMYQ